MSAGMILCVGLNYHTSPPEIRESVALTPDETESALRELRERRSQEAFILSTCNRTEFYTRGGEVKEPLGPVADVVMRLKGIDLREHPGVTYVWRTEDCVRHFFRVTSGLDSMVIGETEIAGQVRQALDIAARAGMSGTVLKRLGDSGVRCSRRVRMETAITEGAISMASVAAGLAAKVLGSLADKKVLVLGAGDTSAQASRHLRDSGVREFMFLNRTLARAEALAAKLGGKAYPLERLASLLPEADLVLSATSAPQPLVDVALAREASRARRGRNTVYVDLAVPRDIHPDVNRLPNVFVYSTESVKHVVQDNLQRRQKEAPRAEEIVREESGKYLGWYRSLAVTPTLATVRAHFEAIRLKKIDDFSKKFRPEEREALDQLTRSLMNDMLREPTLRLMRSKDDPGRGPALTEAIRHLFNLETDAPEEPADENRDPR